MSFGAKRVAGPVLGWLVFGWVGLAGNAAGALEAFDGKLEVHGFYEQQIRSIMDDASGASDWDLTQWYHVLDLEIESEFAPDGFGPFDMMAAFARIEVRFDCVWRRACGLFPSADLYGDRPGRLPARIQSGRSSGFQGTQFLGDKRRYLDLDIDQLAFRFRHSPGLPPTRVANGPQGTSYREFYGQSAGLDGILDPRPDPNSDDPALLLFSNLDECLFANRRTPGPTDGFGDVPLVHNLRCKIEPIHDASQNPNPFRPGDPNERVLRGAGGGLALPMRPAPEVRFDAGAPTHVPQGIWYPNERLQELLADGAFDAFDQNFTVNELQWNRGASQQDEKELKELYLEFDLFDSRLWVRAGKQNVVWGKTELFRTTDQFNPQDLALASLPSLEESRIALWAIRAIWSFYDVGPLQDVRVELAANFDQFEPNDIGRCGEPYTPLVACGKTFGLLNHGQFGVGLAGEVRPPNPWNSWKGIEVGGRLEWRYDRFAFAISDFYGYSDLPYADVVFSYRRNVDPESGRPRKGESTGRCRTGREEACLTPENALLHHSANLSAFAWVCAGTVAVSDFDPSACGQTIFNSRVVPISAGMAAPLPLAGIFPNILSGQAGNLPQNAAVAPAAAFLNGNAFFNGLGGLTNQSFLQLARHAPFAQLHNDTTGAAAMNPVPSALVSLVRDANDGPFALVGDYSQAVQDAIVAGGNPLGFAQGFLQTGMSPYLTDEQEALFGCGAFYQTNCDIDGIDLLNADPNALFEAFPGVQGTFLGGAVWDTTDRSRPQPGTRDFVGYTCADLPGCRGPGDEGYDPRVDGTTAGQVHPFTGQPWRAETSIASWNFLMALIGFSQGEELTTFTANDATDPEVFDPNRPFARGRCSFREPAWCLSVRGLALRVTGLTRASVKAGGNGRFGRRAFLWQGGNDLVLRYEKRNVLGFGMDFAEDRFKSSWSLEFTWIEGVPTTNADVFDGSSDVDEFNLTVSMDRPTFINFLNANRTFLFNLQAFFQYRDGHRQGHVATGPWNAFFTLTVVTGMFRDRLNPSMTFVYDVHSNSGAWLPQLTYRFTESFSATVGLALFQGRFKEADASINGTADGAANRVGRNRDKQFFEPGLSAVRERDEIFLRIRYTF